MFDRVLALQPDGRRGALQSRLPAAGAERPRRRDGGVPARRWRSNPDHDRALYGLALSLIATRRPEEAIAPLKRNTKLQPMSPYGWYQLARVQHELGPPRRDAEDPRPPRDASSPTSRGSSSAKPGSRPRAPDVDTWPRPQSRRRVAPQHAHARSAPAVLHYRKARLYSAAIWTPSSPVGAGRSRHKNDAGIPISGSGGFSGCSRGGACHAVDRAASGVLAQESRDHEHPAVHLVPRDVRR